MQKVYRNTAIFIFLVLIAVQWGFYQSYTSHFPQFKNATPLIHVHGALLMTWMLLLIVQPLLIHYGKAPLHRTIGKVSWLLGPLIIISLFLLGFICRQAASKEELISCFPLHRRLERNVETGRSAGHEGIPEECRIS